MSYSFSVTDTTKAGAKDQISTKFAEVVAQQPSHAADQAAAVAAAGAFIDVLTEPAEGEEIHISVSGSLSWHHEVPDQFRSSNLTVGARLQNKPAA